MGKHRMVKKHRILRMVETFGMNLNPYFRPLRRAQDQRNRKRYQRVWTELQNQRKHQMVKKHRRIWMELLNRKRQQIHWTELPNRKKHRKVKKLSTALRNRKRHRIWTELPNRKDRIVKKEAVISACKFNIAPPMAIRIGNTLIWRMTRALMRRVHIQEQEYVMWW